MKINILLLTLFLSACSLPISTPTQIPEPTLAWTVFPTGENTPASSPTVSPVPCVVATSIPLTVPATGTPGLVIRGRVTLDGAGLAGVCIIRQYSAYPGVVVAITDANGYYESEFMGIPGDEMVAVHAELAGYSFDPEFCHWRHYFGYEEATCNFTALLTP